MARQTRPLDVQGGVLRVQARNSTWANQLAFLESEVISRLNERIGEAVIRDIHWVVGSWREAAGTPTEPPAPRPAQLPAIALSDADLRRIDALSSGINDPEVRRVWQRFLAGELRRAVWRQGRGWSPCPACGVRHRRGPGLCPVCRIANLG